VRPLREALETAPFGHLQRDAVKQTVGAPDSLPRPHAVGKEPLSQTILSG
jgi:hypothetical protein